MISKYYLLCKLILTLVMFMSCGLNFVYVLSCLSKIFCQVFPFFFLFSFFCFFKSPSHCFLYIVYSLMVAWASWTCQKKEIKANLKSILWIHWNHLHHDLHNKCLNVFSDGLLHLNQNVRIRVSFIHVYWQRKTFFFPIEPYKIWGKHILICFTADKKWPILSMMPVFCIIVTITGHLELQVELDIWPTDLKTNRVLLLDKRSHPMKSEGEMELGLLRVTFVQ